MLRLGSLCPVSVLVLASCGGEPGSEPTVLDCETTPTWTVEDPWPGCDDFTGAPLLEPGEPGEPIYVGATCSAPALLELDAIPDQPTLDDGNPETVAIFEVDGHELVGKFVRDRDAAEGGLRLWQEVVLRMPENQLLDLVQFEISTDTDPAAYFNRTGDVTASRYGLKIGFSTDNFTTNQADVCAPLAPRRGTFDWSLVHELGHLRGWVDGSWRRFLDAFADVRGSGEGYPEDGSPVLTGDFVTSYAERADGDEDHAESWTTYVMLGELPAESDDEPLALQKVRWMASQPGLAELRQALRVSEPGGGDVTVDGAPRLTSSVEPIAPPPFLHGTWRADAAPGEVVRQFEFSADNIIEGGFLDGAVATVRDFSDMLECGVLRRYEVNFEEDGGGSLGWGYNATLGEAYDTPLEDSFILDLDGGIVYWTRLSGEEDVVLHPVSDAR